MVLALDSSSLLCLLTVSSLICTSSLNFLLISSSWWSRRWTLSSDEVRADRSFKISALLLIRLSSKCLHSEQPACVQFNVVIHVCKHHNLHVQHHSLSLSLSLFLPSLPTQDTYTHLNFTLSCSRLLDDHKHIHNSPVISAGAARGPFMVSSNVNPNDKQRAQLK